MLAAGRARQPVQGARRPQPWTGRRAPGAAANIRGMFAPAHSPADREAAGYDQVRIAPGNPQPCPGDMATW